VRTKLEQQTTATPRNVARAAVIKDGEIFLVCERSGDVPAGSQDAFGLYYHDCRFLNGYELRISGTRPNVLASSAERGSSARFELTNEQLTHNRHSIAPQTFGVTVERVIDSREQAMHDVFTVENYGVEQHEIVLSFQFSSTFEDIFEIRGLNPPKQGREHKPHWRGGVLIFSYEGADGIERRLEIHPDPRPQKTRQTGAQFTLKLKPGERHEIRLSLRAVEKPARNNAGQNHAGSNRAQTSHNGGGAPARLDRKVEQISAENDERTRDWLTRCSEVQSDSQALNHVMRRSLLDLQLLTSSLDGFEYISAGLPWYGALFGRDSITAALQMLAYDPRIAEQTIRLLARYQGTSYDDWRDEEPGKILHELRRGELAHLNEIPQTPYYGSVDSTPLFLILIGEHANWTGDLGLFNELRSNIERALAWVDHNGHGDNGPYLTYSTRSSKGLANQGWKDSGDSIMNADGSLAEPPIALVEVQGYVYRAKLLIADLYARSGDHEAASRLRRQASELKTHFNQDFWSDRLGFYAIALEKHERRAEVISSNPGQALWTGIVDEARAGAVVRHLMSDDMFTGWGIRTLSKSERRFNPIGYHLGTVWPHDNSIIAAGFRRYGFDSEAVGVMEGMVSAAEQFEHYRLREVFAGFSRRQFEIPVHYPVACHPQAWAAGSVPFMVSSVLGLKADAFNKRLCVVRPVLPPQVSELDFHRIKVGRSTLDLHFSRATDGNVRVVVTRHDGDVEVDVQAEAAPQAA
jgi:glycogen debranching enzyme